MGYEMQVKKDRNKIIKTFNIPVMKRGTIKGKVDRLYNHRLLNQHYIDTIWAVKNYCNNYNTHNSLENMVIHAVLFGIVNSTIIKFRPPLETLVGRDILKKTIELY